MELESRMRTIQNVLREQIAKLPRVALKPILERKLKEQEIELPQDGFDALVDHILNANGEDFHWNDGNTETPNDYRNLKLVFDENDGKEIQKFIVRISEAMPEVIQETIAKGGAQLFSALRASWEVYEAIQRYECEEFQARLEERWGEGLSLLRMLLQSIREIGADVHRRHRKSKSKKYVHRRFVLGRLHVRACQVADEIITLMENGFADGAIARWRTLHEIGVIATIIEDGDEELARRYIDHDIVEVKKQADDYDEKQVPLGYEPIAPRERKRIEEAYAEAIQRYSPSFRHEYGWAAEHLKDKRPDFKKLQAAADQSGMNTYYKLANFNIHAGARAMFFRLTDMGSNIPIAGRSNAGLVEPGQNTAYPMVRITGALIGRPKDLDRMVEMSCLVAMRDAIPTAFHKADRKLRRDETTRQREQTKRRAKRS
ncbi:hypothetical protein SAMN05216404_10487 [Nitrosospira multiformis]|uniref:Uncharacterized protein n=2 Tax=Nitrosospira multiformis TaxID=1231 RepID=A0A1H8G4N5_9PROT|nr:hypothetical protein SAMN05216404_10487 [Nitrosospira multiformis]